MARRNQFTVDAESVQGNAGAEVTLRAMTLGEWNEYRADASRTLSDLVREYVLEWSGFVDKEGHELPSPKDEPEIVNRLYFHELREIQRLLIGTDPN